MTETANELVTAPIELSLSGEPQDILDAARRAAKALQTVIANKPRPVIFNGEQYLELEDWVTVARFYGVTPKIVSTHFIQFEQARGFEAVAVAADSEGREIGRVESMCLDDERNWKGKPLFMLRSMAETRAQAKVLRTLFGWIAVLGGLAPNNAEEFERGTNEQIVDYIAALRTSLLQYTNGNKRGAVDILKDLTDKTDLRELNQDEAKKAVETFESRYLGAECRMD